MIENTSPYKSHAASALRFLSNNSLYAYNLAGKLYVSPIPSAPALSIPLLPEYVQPLAGLGLTVNSLLGVDPMNTAIWTMQLALGGTALAAHTAAIYVEDPDNFKENIKNHSIKTAEKYVALAKNYLSPITSLFTVEGSTESEEYELEEDDDEFFSFEEDDDEFLESEKPVPEEALPNAIVEYSKKDGEAFVRQLNKAQSLEIKEPIAIKNNDAPEQSKPSEQIPEVEPKSRFYGIYVQRKPEFRKEYVPQVQTVETNRLVAFLSSVFELANTSFIKLANTAFATPSKLVDSMKSFLELSTETLKSISISVNFSKNLSQASYIFTR